jgi:hypothetical protein
MLRRIGSAGIEGDVTAVRAIMHGAMAIYLARYLNVPPAALAARTTISPTTPAHVETIRTALLDAFDRQRQVDLAASLVTRYLALGDPAEPLIIALAFALLREDAGFHAYQMREADVRQFSVWGNTGEDRQIMIAIARHLASHSPTERKAL